MRVAKLVLAAALAVGLILVAAGAPTAASLPPGCASPAPAHPTRLGDVAYLRGRALHVVDLAAGADRSLAVLPLGQPSPAALAWSPDGRWITAGNVLVAARNGALCEPFGPGFSGLQWRPGSQELLARAARGRVVIGEPGRVPRTLLPAGFGVAAGAFDPAGDRLVTEGPGASLWVVDVASGTRRRVWRSPSPSGALGPPFPGRWSGDGRFILFQTDPFRSASIAADGTPLWAVPAGGGAAVELERNVLVSPDFAVPCGRGARVVVSAGGDRYVTHAKHVDLVSPPRWKPRTIAGGRGRSWYAAACSPDGALAAATVTANGEERTFDTAQRTIWLMASDGSMLRPLVRAAGGVSAEQPRWSRDGQWILYVEHPARPYPVARLYLVNVTNGRRLGPFAEIAAGLGYFGLHDWNDLAAWYQPA